MNELTQSYPPSLITERHVEIMLKQGYRISFYTGFHIWISGVKYECAHPFSF